MACCLPNQPPEVIGPVAHPTESFTAPSAAASRLSRAPRGSTVSAYALVVAAIAAVTLLRFPVDYFLHGHAPYALYYLPILLAAWFGGVGPTSLAVVLSVASALVFVVPRDEPG